MRVIVEVLRRIDLLQNAVLHDRDAAGHGHGLHLVVGHVDERGGQALVQTGQLGTGLDAQLGIQVRKRLVEEEDGGLTDDGATHSHTLALTTGELLRLAVEQVTNVQDVGCFLHTAVDVGLGRLAQLETEGHVVIDTHVRVERVALEHHGNVTILGRHIVDHTIANHDIAFADLLQPGEQAQTGGLATTRRADEHKKLFVFNLDVQIVDRDHVAEALVHMIVGDASHLGFSPLDLQK